MNSIAYVMRKRKGITSVDITKATPVLITEESFFGRRLQHVFACEQT